MNSPYKIDRDQVVNEARAKIYWGDDPEDVVKYLRMNQFGVNEAEEMVEEWWNDRVATIRRYGLRKIMGGIPIALASLAGVILIAGLPPLPGKLYIISLLVMVILWGLWLVLRGTLMSVSPGTEHGDIADK